MMPRNVMTIAVRRYQRFIRMALEQALQRGKH
jgi:hypothetical protein